MFVYEIFRDDNIIVHYYIMLLAANIRKNPNYNHL